MLGPVIHAFVGSCWYLGRRSLVIRSAADPDHSVATAAQNLIRLPPGEI